MRILIVKTSSMGDIIHCLPIIADITRHIPNAQIDWLVEASFKDIVACHPKINSIITVSLRTWRKSLYKAETRQQISAFKTTLRAQFYDVILDMQSLVKSALLCRLARGIVHGQTFQCTREPLAALFYHKTFAVHRDRHALDQNRALAAAALGYDISNQPVDYGLVNYGLNMQPSDAVQPADAQTTEMLRSTLNQPFILGFHGTSRDSKLWLTQHWITLAKLLKTKNYQLALPWSTPAEHTRALEIAEAAHNVVVLPKSSLRSMSKIIAHAKAAIGVDTGLMHLAVAQNIPTIALYIDTFPTLNGAYAGQGGQAINMGGKAEMPKPEDVFQTLVTMLPNKQ